PGSLAGRSTGAGGAGPASAPGAAGPPRVHSGTSRAALQRLLALRFALATKLSRAAPYPPPTAGVKGNGRRSSCRAIHWFTSGKDLGRKFGGGGRPILPTLRRRVARLRVTPGASGSLARDGEWEYARPGLRVASGLRRPARRKATPPARSRRMVM